MEVNCETMAVMGATLANGGVCPTTSKVALNPSSVRDVLSLMHSCGMYNYSGQFAFNVSFHWLTYYMEDHKVVRLFANKKNFFNNR
jgi:glutaminase